MWLINQGMEYISTAAAGTHKTQKHVISARLSIHMHDELDRSA